MKDVTRFPLCWPPGRPRTPREERTHSQFHRRTKVEGASYTTKAAITLAGAKRVLNDELARLGAESFILSTNIELNRYGEPKSDKKAIADPGAAVYFTHQGREMAFACDRWNRVEENVRAIAKTIEALRGIERWGTGEMVQAAFTGFLELPMHVPPAPWYVVLGVKAHDSTEAVKAAYSKLVLKHHPDRGGDSDKMAEINRAFEAFKRERGL